MLDEIGKVVDTVQETTEEPKWKIVRASHSHTCWVIPIDAYNPHANEELERFVSKERALERRRELAAKIVAGGPEGGTLHECELPNGES